MVLLILFLYTPRKRRRITNRGTTTECVTKQGANLYSVENNSVRSVAASFNIRHVSLYRSMKKLKLHLEMIYQNMDTDHTIKYLIRFKKINWFDM